LQQLTLNLQARDEATLENFYVGDNEELMCALKLLEHSREKLLYLWGGMGSGRTHLLLASCNKFSAQGVGTAIYIPLSDAEFTPESLRDLAGLPLLCIDDLDQAVGNRAWEEALFDCCNERFNNNVATVIGASATPAALNFIMPDLQSRMNSGLIFEVKKLNDEQKLAALRLRAQCLGLELPDVTARFLLGHYLRDTHALFALLHRLDRASLVAQRCLTIPFVKEILQQEDGAVL
jgi:DnaA family protein